jgi:hypothetical protein
VSYRGPGLPRWASDVLGPALDELVKTSTRENFVAAAGAGPVQASTTAAIASLAVVAASLTASIDALSQSCATARASVQSDRINEVDNAADPHFATGESSEFLKMGIDHHVSFSDLDAGIPQPLLAPLHLPLDDRAHLQQTRACG